MTQDFDRTMYLNISIKYRIVLVVVCTLAYLSFIVSSGNLETLKLFIAFGMLASCFLAVHVYLKIWSQVELRKWIKVILALEMFAYGIFTFLSGGFSSPYFWYHIGCLFVMMAVQFNMIFIILGMLWCLSAAVANKLIGQEILVRQDINLLIGSIIITVTFYILLRYLQRVLEHQNLQKELNIRLEQEKERSEQALKITTELYDTVNLFAMTDPYKVMEELGLILWRTIAPEGCVLVKLCPDGTVEKQTFCGIEEPLASRIADAAFKQKDTDEEDGGGSLWQETVFSVEQVQFESIAIGKFQPLQGLLIRKRTDAGRSFSEMDGVYCGLAEIIFRNLDVQNQLEEYITAEEQHRLAGEIHDTVLQKLFGIACSLKLLKVNCEDRNLNEEWNQVNVSQVIEKIQTLKTSVELLMKELREMIYGRGFINEEDTFKAKLENYMEEVEKLCDVDIRLQLDDKIDVITPAQKVAVYRIACEAVNNAVRHGQAQHVSVGVQLDRDAIRAEIVDNGIGYKDSSAVNPHGKGLKNMRRMVFLLKGQFEIESGKERGTTVRFSLPL